MIRKGIHILMICLLIFTLGTGGQLKEGRSTYTYRISFGVKIGILPNGELTQYVLAYYTGKQLTSLQPISFQQLINIGSGKWPLPNSATFVNIFEEAGLKNDTLPDGEVLHYTAAFDSLWKIRFDAHPFVHQLGKGWSQGEIRPSLKQQEYIYNRYGVRGYDQDYFVDTSFFRLLKDVIDPNWIAEYKSLY